jgi:hypothetical protein
MFRVDYIGKSGAGYSYTDNPDAFGIQWDVIVIAVSERIDLPAMPNPTDNCIYNGEAIGHSKGFCTADSCY